MKKHAAGESGAAESSAASQRRRIRDLADSVLPTKDGRRGLRAASRGGKRKTLSNSAGRPKELTNVRRHLIAKTGMLPLDFLTAVFRNELYDEYERVPAGDGKTFYFVPSKTAKTIPVDLDQRIHAATAAAPYMHRKMPQGIEVGDKTERVMLAEQLRGLSTKELDAFVKVYDKLTAKQIEKAPPSLQRAAIVGSRTYTQDGQEIPAE